MLAAEVEDEEDAVTLPDRTFLPYPWRIPDLDHVISVTPTSQEFVNLKLYGSNDSYRLDKARKGQALIISIDKFELPSQRLAPLPAYGEDVKKLAFIFDRIGFNVFSFDSMPGQLNHCLTAKEIEKAVDVFASLLSENDQCAVVAILSHGGEGFIYGADGKKVYLEPLLRKLDNVNCIKMANKPKFVIIQACQGATSDQGVTCRTGPNDNSHPPSTPAGPQSTRGVVIPAISEFIIAYSAMKGYSSFTRGNESIYIKHFVENLAAHVASLDLLRILTKVNRAVSEELIPYNNEGLKQMPRFESCLTKDLYFFPHPHGKNGPDWYVGHPAQPYIPQLMLALGDLNGMLFGEFDNEMEDIQNDNYR